jgi:hypothetical protein
MRALIVALMLVLPSVAGASPQLLFLAANQIPMESFTINGNSSVTTTTTATTGSESISTGAGNVTVAATCTASGIAAAVELWVDAANPTGTPGRLLCPGGSGTSSATIYVPVSAGSHAIEVKVIGNGGTATGNTFRKPTP